MSSLQRHEPSIVRKVDRLLGIYYLSQNQNDYYDTNGNGKFYNWCEEQGFADDDDILEELQHDLDENVLLFFIDEHGEFPCYEPLLDTDPEKHKKEQFLHLIRLYADKEDVLIVSWWNIAECLKHEMYTAIYSKVQEAIKEVTSSIDMYGLGAGPIRKFIFALQNKKKLTNREVIFIQNAVKRARHFTTSKDDLSIS